MKPQVLDPLSLLHDLDQRVRKADGFAAARLTLVNGLHRLIPFDQSVLWVGQDMPVAASSIDTPDPQAPHVQQLVKLFRQKLAQLDDLSVLEPADLTGIDLYSGHHGLFVPLKSQKGGLLLVRPSAAYTSAQGVILEFALRICAPEILPSKRAGLGVSERRQKASLTRNWLLGLGLAAASTALAGLITVPQTLMVPVEIVSSDIYYVKAPIDGVVEEILVLPGEVIEQAQDIIRLDTQQIVAQLQIATAELERLDVQYEQEAILSLTSEAARTRAAELSGLLREKFEQVVFLQTQLERHTISAGQRGIVVMPDAEALRGRPVATGETLVQIASPDRLAVDLWIPLATALPVGANDWAAIFLATRPTGSYAARIEYVTPQAQQREDGTMGYRARAHFEDAVPSNLLGQQGVARIHLGDTTLLMRVIRQPLVWLRQAIGI